MTLRESIEGYCPGAIFGPILNSVCEFSSPHDIKAPPLGKKTQDLTLTLSSKVTWSKVKVLATITQKEIKRQHLLRHSDPHCELSNIVMMVNDNNPPQF